MKNASIAYSLIALLVFCFSCQQKDSVQIDDSIDRVSLPDAAIDEKMLCQLQLTCNYPPPSFLNVPLGKCVFDLRDSQIDLYEDMLQLYADSGSPHGPITTLYMNFHTQGSNSNPFLHCIGPYNNLDILEFTLNDEPFNCPGGYDVGYISITCNTYIMFSFTYETATGGPYSLDFENGSSLCGTACNTDCCWEGLMQEEPQRQYSVD